jgi:seryl-tRNA synthetase
VPRADLEKHVVRARFDGKNLEPAHTLNGTAVTDRATLAILENFQGGVPDVLRQFGAPERVSG